MKTDGAAPVDSTTERGFSTEASDNSTENTPENRRTRPAQFPFLPWFPRDFASSTRGWPLIARGAYRELLDAEWDMGALPVEPEKLRSVALATKSEWKIAWEYLEPKFPVVEGKRLNARLEAHRQDAVRRYEAHSRGARKTNESRKAKVASP